VPQCPTESRSRRARAAAPRRRRARRGPPVALQAPDAAGRCGPLY
jgi:hypothetical protein